MENHILEILIQTVLIGVGGGLVGGCIGSLFLTLLRNNVSKELWVKWFGLFIGGVILLIISSLL